MNNKILLDNIKKLFIQLGFERIEIDNNEYLKYNDCYCRITYLKSLKAFVIESADSFDDAKKGLLEDGDLYYIDTDEETLLKSIKIDIQKYYII